MINVALLGFGVVGSGTAEVLDENRAQIQKYVGDTVAVKYILDLRDFPDSPYASLIVHDFDVILNDPEVSIVAEMIGVQIHELLVPVIRDTYMFNTAICCATAEECLDTLSLFYPVAPVQ